MNHFKTFLLGFGAAFAIYYVTRKGEDGRSIIDDLLDNPKAFMKQAEAHLLEDAAHVVKEGLS